MKTNFVLVDFENVQPRNMGLLKGGPFHIKVFLGKRQGLPATLKTLRTTIASLFKPALADSELDALVAEMKRRGKIVVTGTKVAYALA